MDELPDAVNIQIGLDNKRARRFRIGFLRLRAESLEQGKEVASMKLRVLRWLLPVSIFVLAAFNGSGPWPPK
jgi:hypothetical protein